MGNNPISSVDPDGGMSAVLFSNLLTAAAIGGAVGGIVAALSGAEDPWAYVGAGMLAGMAASQINFSNINIENIFGDPTSGTVTAGSGGAYHPSRIDLQGGNVVSGLVNWFSYIEENRGLDPFTKMTFNVSDIIDGSTIPEKSFFNNIFSGMTSDGIKGRSIWQGGLVQWHIADRNYMSNYKHNYIRGIREIKDSNTRFRLLAVHNNHSRMSLMFHDEKIFKIAKTRIFGK